MKAIRYRFFNIVCHKPMSTVYTALVKPGETFFGNPEGVALRRCKDMIVHEGDIRLQLTMRVSAEPNIVRAMPNREEENERSEVNPAVSVNARTVSGRWSTGGHGAGVGVKALRSPR
jgi:hypothetical protein